MMSVEISELSEFARNSCNPALTTIARWLFLYLSESVMASSIF